VNVILINPNLVLQKDDMFTTGIVYMPVSLAYFAAVLRDKGCALQIIDAFGENPNQWWTKDQLMFRGLTPRETAARINSGTRVVVLYAVHVTYHAALLQIIRAIKSKKEAPRIIVMENTQAVTAYSLRRIQEEFYDAGADFILTGEPEVRGAELVDALLSGDEGAVPKIDGIGFRKEGNTHYIPPARKIENLDLLPFAAWDLFPLTNYWKLHYAHGPFSSTKYLPLLTSRGCPYPCKFCVIPETNDQKWRSKSAGRVVEEIQFLAERFGVREFHIEDVDPTIDDRRTREICQGILDKKMKIQWKLCSGTKVESIRSAETVDLMARSGCTYISISPESGSPKVLKLINKPFDLSHAEAMIERMSKDGVYSQACFVLGFPGEEDVDRELTRKLLIRLTRLGVDEVAIFIITPIPGSAIQQELTGYESYSQLTFSPTWRRDYDRLNRFRLRLYSLFLINKLLFHPLKFCAQPLRFLVCRFQTKMEMVPYRALHTTLMRLGVVGRRVKAESL